MSIFKKYYATSRVAFNIPYGNGYRRIAFDSMGDGRAIYITRDEKEQEGIEKNVDFGRLISLAETVDESKKPKEEKPVEKPADKKEIKKVDISDPEDAREYLANNFSVARSNIRTLAKIKEAAKLAGIEFTGL